jgi:hypothetical protein
MRLRDTALRILAAACLALAGLPASARKNILYVSTEGVEHRYFGAAYTAFKDELDKVLPLKTVVYVENLDLPRFAAPGYRTSLAAWLRKKYGTVHFDAAVTAGTPAMKFAAESRRWSGVPTYFAHANEDTVRTFILPPGFSGQTYSVNFGKTLELIRELLPNTRRIALIGSAPGDDVYRPFFSGELEKYKRDFDFIDLRGKPLDDIVKAVSSLDGNTVIHQRIGLSRAQGGRTAGGNAAVSHAGCPHGISAGLRLAPAQALGHRRIGFAAG